MTHNTNDESRTTKTCAVPCIKSIKSVFLVQVKTISEELGVGFIGLGFDPKHSFEQIPMMPKGRYALMRSYMPTVGTMGLDMMFRTCTVQVGCGHVHGVHSWGEPRHG